MARCKDCIHYDVCKYHPLAIGVDICDVFKNTADVVPRAEVREIFEDIDTILLGHLMGNYDIEDTMDAIRKLKKKRTEGGESSEKG